MKMKMIDCAWCWYEQPITTLDDAKEFIRELYGNGMLWHFDDDATEIFPEEGKELNKRRDELYKFNWGSHYQCPIGFGLAVMGEDDPTINHENGWQLLPEDKR